MGVAFAHNSTSWVMFKLSHTLRHNRHQTTHKNARQNKGERHLFLPHEDHKLRDRKALLQPHVERAWADLKPQAPLLVVSRDNIIQPAVVHDSAYLGAAPRLSESGW